MISSDLYFDLHVDYASRRIAMSGEFDAATARCLATAIRGFQRAARGHITIRLHDLTYIDAAGVDAILDAQKAQSRQGMRLTVTGATLDVRRAFNGARHSGLLQAVAA